MGVNKMKQILLKNKKKNIISKLKEQCIKLQQSKVTLKKIFNLKQMNML